MSSNDSDIPSLWPDTFPIEALRTPLSILRKQANDLALRTQGILKGSVITTRIKESVLHHSFQIVVPALDDYRYDLFTVRHDVELYPAHVYFPKAPDDETVWDAEDEVQFITSLRYILTSKPTIHIIQSLMYQAIEAQEGTADNLA